MAVKAFSMESPRCDDHQGVQDRDARVIRDVENDKEATPEEREDEACHQRDPEGKTLQDRPGHATKRARQHVSFIALCRGLNLCDQAIRACLNAVWRGSKTLRPMALSPAASSFFSG